MRRSQRVRQTAATLVEFALVAPLFLGVVVGIFSFSVYVFEVQVANHAAQAAGRWVVEARYWTGTPPVPQCPEATPPPGMLSAAKAASGPFANSISVTDTAAPSSSSSGLRDGTYGCEVQVTLPFVNFTSYFGLGPKTITATAIDYVT